MCICVRVHILTRICVQTHYFSIAEAQLTTKQHVTVLNQTARVACHSTIFQLHCEEKHVNRI